MKKICFLIPDGTLRPATLFGVLEVFEKANVYAEEHNKRPFYEICLAGVNANQRLHNSLLSIKTSKISDIKAQDLILIPPLDELCKRSTKQSKAILEWLVACYKAGTELASLCTGSFFLAETGLLKDLECSTHWKAGTLFNGMFPDVKLRVDKIITDKNGIYSAGGAISSLNLALYLVEKHTSRDVALYCAKILEIDIERYSQSQFILFEGQKNHGDDAIKKIQLFIEKNVEEKITVELLADKFGISKRSMIRRFKKATNNPPMEYVQRIKIEAAKRSLESGFKTISEIMYSVGYNDMKAFRSIFKKITGIAPADYRNKFNKKAALHAG